MRTTNNANIDGRYVYLKKRMQPFIVGITLSYKEVPNDDTGFGLKSRHFFFLLFSLAQSDDTKIKNNRAEKKQHVGGNASRNNITLGENRVGGGGYCCNFSPPRG